MGKIIIKGNFTVETDYGFMNNFKQPLEHLEMEVTELNPIKINKMNSVGQTKLKE